jgi:small subunit ribosomal protein S6
MADVLRDYELVFIAVPQLDDQGVATLTERVSGWVTAAGGVITGTNIWGRRPLAYAIRKFKEGTYVQLNFQLVPNATRELERILRIEEQVIRHLLVRPDEQ